jgi:hypothetical protein
MKKILLALLLPISGYAQGLNFTIKPYVVRSIVVLPSGAQIIKKSDTSTKLSLSLCGIDSDSTCVSYSLFKSDGLLFETGIKKVPNNVVSIILADPINITYLNQVLSFWNVEAIRQD